MEGDCFLLLTGFRRLVISIHSLRMEGDGKPARRTAARPTFQSTPSAWRETEGD